MEPPRDLGGVLVSCSAAGLAALSSLTDLRSLRLECTFMEPGTLPAALTNLQHLTSLQLNMHRHWHHSSVLVLPAAAFRSWMQLRRLALTNARLQLEQEDVAAGWQQLEVRCIFKLHGCCSCPWCVPPDACTNWRSVCWLVAHEHCSHPRLCFRLFLPSAVLLAPAGACAQGFDCGGPGAERPAKLGGPIPSGPLCRQPGGQPRRCSAERS